MEDRRPRARRGRRAEGMGSGERRRSPAQVWGSGGIAPGKFLKFNLQICVFCGIFAPVSAECNGTYSNFGSLGGVRGSSLGGNRAGSVP